MTSSERLRISVGQHSEQGRKQANQDFHGACMPAEPLLTTKGCAVVIADGISTSEVGRVASESAVAGFLADYYSTPEPWSVKTSAQRVLAAINSWLYAQTRQGPHRYDRERGYVCTLSALVVKSTTAHVIHVGDARVYRRSNGTLEQLTNDHRIRVTEDLSYLGAPLGIGEHVEIEYRALHAEAGDVYMLATDGIHEHLEPGRIAAALELHADDLDAAARAIVAAAYERGSDDNMTAQLVRIENIPGETADELYRRLTSLPFAPVLESGVVLDGYRIVREVHASNRSHVCLAVDEETGRRVALKTLSTELENDPAHASRAHARGSISSGSDTRPCSISIPRCRAGSTARSERRCTRTRTGVTRRSRSSSATCAIRAATSSRVRGRRSPIASPCCSGKAYRSCSRSRSSSFSCSCFDEARRPPVPESRRRRGPLRRFWKTERRSRMMNKVEMSETILVQKSKSGMSWEDIADRVGLNPVFVTAACLGQCSMPREYGDRLTAALELPDEIAAALALYPYKGMDQTVPTDPLVYRFHEIMQVYGTSLKEVIHEKFGDGIMSAIDFTLDVERQEDPKGDRVVVTMNGKFLPYRIW